MREETSPTVTLACPTMLCALEVSLTYRRSSASSCRRLSFRTSSTTVGELI